ncbi:MAG: amino acid ABC transporter permease [Arcanobacterium sp.]|nr:amino acid ABC transporter permease [Arcanobacterium sp.]MDY5589395.1 amino acid ABC transporter permease [Arcanobacterium sp.]
MDSHVFTNTDWVLLFQGNNFSNLLLGLWVSVRIALISMVGSIVLGILLGMAMTTRNLLAKWLTLAYVEIMRLAPQIVLLFVVFFWVSRKFPVNIGGETAAIIVFTLWGTAEMGDLVRGAISSIPAHQYYSASALGMTHGQTMRYVTLPLAVRQLIPLTVNLTTRMIKTTSLISLIGVIEVLKMAQVIIDRGRFDYPNAALWVYATVFFMYFIVCYTISLVAKYLEKRLAL